MPRLSNEKIEEIRNKTNPLSSYIGKYINVTRKGNGYWAVCPFHNDSSPSLSISDDKGIWKCFSCSNPEAKKGGDVFKFVQLYKKYNSWIDAVKDVAEVTHVSIDELNNVKKSKYQNIYDVLDETIFFSNGTLTATKKGLEAMNYLNDRGIDKGVANYFNIGYIPEDNELYNYLKSKNLADNDIFDAYVCAVNNKGPYDIFRGRITFPIHNKYGKPIAFSARDYKWIKGSKTSKYINTKETKLYVKGNNLYNYHRAIKYCKEANEVIVVEGVMDVIAYYRAGIKNVVATLGTAVSDVQLLLLKELSNNLVLSFDGDNAGKHANLDLGIKALKADMNVYVLDTNTKLDPDEIINKYGSRKLVDLYNNNKVPYYDFFIKCYSETIKEDTYEERNKLREKLSSLVDSFNLAPKLNKEFKFKINSLIKKGGITSKVKVNKTESLNGLVYSRNNIINLVCKSKKNQDKYTKELNYLDDDNYTNLLEEIKHYKNKNRLDEISLDELLKTDIDELNKTLIRNIIKENNEVDPYFNETLDDSINKIKRKMNQLKKDMILDRISELANLIQEYKSKNKDSSDLDKEILSLSRQLDKIQKEIRK